MGKFDNDEKKKVYPISNAVITIDDGKIKKVEWDNGCFYDYTCDS